jgi:hypothetical protein
MLQAFAGALLTAQTVNVPSAPSTVRWHDVSIEDYRQHLIALATLVDGCAKARDGKGCDPALIGPDDRVPIVIGSRSEPRMVRYGWLRVLFSKAEDADEKPSKPAANKTPTSKPEGLNQTEPVASQLLKDAKVRLESDLAQSGEPEPTVADHARERATMEQVLAGPDFRSMKQATVRDSVLEKLDKWLNQIFESASNLRARSAWVGRALVWGFILAICVALVYSLLRLERRWRVKLTPEEDPLAPGAASARDWQLWLDDARRCAALGQWREAIHFVYWAAISRLESRRLWPADRARTPREYLALVAAEDPRKPGLSQLTSTFERFWYGGRAAAESDYQNAESVASSLISGNATSSAAALSTAPEGGAR